MEGATTAVVAPFVYLLPPRLVGSRPRIGVRGRPRENDEA